MQKKARLYMKDKNTMGKIEYIVENIIWIVTSMIWHKKILFRCLPNITYTTSRIVLWSMLFASIAICFLWSFRKRRTIQNILISLLFPYGIYTVCSYWKILQSRIIVIFFYFCINVFTDGNSYNYTQN